MSSDKVVLRVEGLGKRFQVGRIQQYKTLRDTFTHACVDRFRDMRGWVSGASKQTRGTTNDLWALRNISFEIRQGEAVGIIGGNGAGKSTLLKILSRITEPTEGEGLVYGRVGSLLEVGTGFHPELTGRENIYLNGAILGMRRSEIRRKFDAIVEFAEIARFIDTPVKHYSSGMYMRLAFSVAAHLEPDILMVDEVLAVGDAAFQKKCLGRMNEVTGEGRTVLFVSHNMGAIRSLCPKSILLCKGEVLAVGPTEEVIGVYLDQVDRADDCAQIPALVEALPPDPDFRMLALRLSQRGKPTLTPADNAPIEITVDYEVRRPVTGLRVYFDLCDDIGEIVIRSFHDEHCDAKKMIQPGRYQSTGTIPGDLLAARRYVLVVRASIHNLRTCTGAGVRVPIRVQSSGRLNRAYPDDPIRSKIMPHIEWETTCQKQR